MVWRLPWRRAASSTMTVPVALAWWLASGSATLRGTLPSAARCTTASAPSNARRVRRRRGSIPSTKRDVEPVEVGAEPGRQVVDDATDVDAVGRRAAVRHRFDADESCSAGDRDLTGAWVRSNARLPRYGAASVRFRLHADAQVLWVVKGLGPGGAERLLAAAARSHDAARFTIECAYVLPWKDHLVGELEAAGVRTHCLSTGRTDPRWPLRLTKLIRDGDYDVVHVHSPLPGSVARAGGAIAAHGRPARASSRTEHNRWETHRLPTRLLNRLTSRWDDRDLRRHRRGARVDAGRARSGAVTLRHGIDIDARRGGSNRPRCVRDELGICADELRGRHGRRTSARRRTTRTCCGAARAARRPRRRRCGSSPSARARRRPRSGRLHDRARAVDDVVILTGFRDDAVRVMAACDVFTLASQWEGLPVAVMEALRARSADRRDGGRRHGRGVHRRCRRSARSAGRRRRARRAGERVIDDRELLRTVSPDASRSKAADVRHRERPSRRSRRRTSARAPAASGRHRGDADRAGTTPAAARRRRSTSARQRRAIATRSSRCSQRSLGSDGDPRYPGAVRVEARPEPVRSRRRCGWPSTAAGSWRSGRLMRWEFVRGGQVLRAVRAVDTATDPDYQGTWTVPALTMHGARDGARRRCRLRVQHAEHAEPARLSEDGVA